MCRKRNGIFVAAPIIFGLLFALTMHAASLKSVERSDWTDGANVPNYVTMHIYVPDNLRTNPAIVVSAHSCGGSPNVQLNNMDYFKATTDETGDIILIIPDNPGRDCWEVASKATLTHDGGGDSHAVAQMVRYAIKKYDADPERVYICGGSSGGMLTQVIAGVYPELFVAAAARAGLPCGDGWNGGGCTGGSKKTGEEWGDIVRAINPDYKGHRPRVALFHGNADFTINYNCHTEGIKQWTNVLGLPETPDSLDTIKTKIATYHQQFWKNECGFTSLQAWTAPGKGHSMDYEEEAWMSFFGLDSVGARDPELAKCEETATVGISKTKKNMPACHFFIKEKTLVLNTITADETYLKIINTVGQIQYGRNYTVHAQAGSISVPLSFLPPGFYIASLVFRNGNKRTDSNTISFIFTK